MVEQNIIFILGVHSEKRSRKSKDKKESTGIYFCLVVQTRNIQPRSTNIE